MRFLRKQESLFPMEIAGADGSQAGIYPGQILELGRGHGINSSERTISRRQISFSIPQFTEDGELRVQFEVLGRNPVYVSRDDGVKVFRRFQRGVMESGDRFCLSAQDPVWYTLRGSGGAAAAGVRPNDLEGGLARDLDSGLGFDGAEDLPPGDVDVSSIDPVTEFGFLEMGHEFDSYPKKMVCDIKNWEWFLEEERRDSGDDEDEGRQKRKRGMRKNRKKGTDEDDDDEWTAESEGDAVIANKLRKGQRPKYSTRSKDFGKSKKDTGKRATPEQNQDTDNEDENDETLGGFIVDDENLDDEEEEEEFDDEEDE